MPLINPPESTPTLRVSHLHSRAHGFRYEVHWGFNVAESIRGILWSGVECAPAWSQDLNLALSSSKIIRDLLLPRDFLERPAAEQLAILREVLDGYEWRAACWPRKIEEAEAWIARATAVMPAPARMNRQTQLRVRLAECASSCMSHREIAEALGITSQRLYTSRNRQRVHLSHDLLGRLGFPIGR
jgi:hypothetical protein